MKQADIDALLQQELIDNDYVAPPTLSEEEKEQYSSYIELDEND